MEPIGEIPRDEYWRIGYDDGLVGQIWTEHRRILQVQAERDKAEAVADLERQLEQERAEEALAKAASERETKSYQSMTDLLLKVREDRDRHHAQYALRTAWGFIVAAIAIMGADFPLSRTIAKEIVMGDEAEAIFSHTTFIALGIVAMGLFFKLLADPLTRPRYLLPKYLQHITIFTAGALAIIMAGGVAIALGSLGIFRGNALITQGTTINEVVYGEASTTAPPTTTTAAPTTGSSQTMIGNVRAALTGLDITFIAQIAFLALALALPMIGGIFLSTGLARLHNCAQLKRLEAEHPDRVTAHAHALRAQHERHANVVTLEREVKNALVQPTLANARYHNYLHGYERGLCTITPGASIAQEIKAFIQRRIGAARQHENRRRTETVAHAPEQ